MREPPAVNLNLRPPLLMLRPVPLRMPPHLGNELIPHLARNPVVRLCKEEEELGHAEAVRLASLEHLPQLLLPLVVGNGGHLVGAHVQRLPDGVAALEEAGRDGRGLRAEAHHVAAPEVQDKGGDEEEEDGDECV